MSAALWETFSSELPVSWSSSFWFFDASTSTPGSMVTRRIIFSPIKFLDRIRQSKTTLLEYLKDIITVSPHRIGQSRNSFRCSRWWGSVRKRNAFCTWSLWWPQLLGCWWWFWQCEGWRRFCERRGVIRWRCCFSMGGRSRRRDGTYPWQVCLECVRHNIMFKSSGIRGIPRGPSTLTILDLMCTLTIALSALSLSGSRDCMWSDAGLQLQLSLLGCPFA